MQIFLIFFPESVIRWTETIEGPRERPVKQTMRGYKLMKRKGLVISLSCEEAIMIV